MSLWSGGPHGDQADPQSGVSWEPGSGSRWAELLPSELCLNSTLDSCAQKSAAGKHG